MNYVYLIVLGIVVLVSLIFKLIAAFIIARPNVSARKAKIIGRMFDFNPLSIFKKN